MSVVSFARDARLRLFDTLQNFVSGLGTIKDPRSHTHFIFRELNRQQLENAYRSDWMARRIVDLPAEDATREWRTWQTDPDKIDKITKLERKFDVQKKVRQAVQKARLYGGAALVLGVDQGQPEEELDLMKVGADDLKFVVVLHRYELMAGPRIYNVASPWYTRPEYYTVATPMFGFHGEPGGAYPGSTPQGNVGGVTGRDPAGRFGASPPQPNYGKPGPASRPDGDINKQMIEADYGMIQVHPSRVIEFAGNEIPDWRLVPMGGGWGDSVLQTVDDTLRDFAMIVGGLASLINDMKMDVVKIPELSRKLSTKELTQKTLERFTLSNEAKSSINTLLLDKDEEWERITTSFGSTPELIKVAMTLACGAGGIPESRMMGNSPNKGLASQGSSGGEVDIRNYYDDIASKQKTTYKPMLLPLDICLQASALGKFNPDVDYDWNPLYQPDPAQVAQVQLQKAQTTQAYITMALFNEDLMRQAASSQISEDGLYPAWDDAVEEHGLEPEEPPQPLEPVPPTPPPGFVPKGAFDPNPFHMLRAQQQAKAGQPIRVPPNRPPGQQQYRPVPPGAAQAQQKPNGKTKDAWEEDAFDPKEERDEQGRWTAAAAEAVLRSGNHVTDIGQLSPKARSHLEKLTKQGHAFKDIDRGYPVPKTRFAPHPDFVSDAELEDFNPYHDPHTGRFTSSGKLAHGAGTEAVAGALRAGPNANRSAAAKAAHAARKAREAEAFPLPAGATAGEAGRTAVARLIAKRKGVPTRGEVSAAAKADIKGAVEEYMATRKLKQPKLPPGVSADEVKTAIRLNVATNRFLTDPETHKVTASAITRNSMRWMAAMAGDLPQHALMVAHHSIVNKIADGFHEFVADAVMTYVGHVIGGAVGGTAIGGPAGGLVGAVAGALLHSEIEHGVEKIAEKAGVTPEHIREALHGLGHVTLGQYRKWRQVAAHRAKPIEWSGFDAEPGDAPDLIEDALEALAEALDGPGEPIDE